MKKNKMLMIIMAITANIIGFSSLNMVGATNVDVTIDDENVESNEKVDVTVKKTEEKKDLEENLDKKENKEEKNLDKEEEKKDNEIITERLNNYSDDTYKNYNTDHLKNITIPDDKEKYSIDLYKNNRKLYTEEEVCDLLSNCIKLSDIPQNDTMTKTITFYNDGSKKTTTKLCNKKNKDCDGKKVAEIKETMMTSNSENDKYESKLVMEVNSKISKENLNKLKTIADEITQEEIYK